MSIKKQLMTCSAVLSICAVMTACGVDKLDPQEYCTVQVTGAEGYAKASLVTNYSGLELAATSNLDKKADEFDKLQAVFFANTIDFEITSEKENLKNGDVVEVSVVYNEDTAKEYGFAFKKDSFKPI